MKKLIYLFTILMTINFNAQKKFAEYYTDYWPDIKKFDIEVSGNNEKLDAIWINVRTLDDLRPKGFIKIPINKLPEFIEYLNASKAKYEEWTKIAKENNVLDVTKEIDIKKFSTTVAFQYGKWQFTTARINPRFLLSKGVAKIVFGTHELTSLSNQFIKSEGLALVFTSIDEINDFISLFDVNKMQEFLNKDSDKKDLFK